MENTNNKEVEEEHAEKKSIDYLQAVGIAFAIVLAFVYFSEERTNPKSLSSQNDSGVTQKQYDVSALTETVVPSGGITIPVVWGDLGVQMIEEGVIDKDKFETLYAQRGGLQESEMHLLTKEDNQHIDINQQNAGVLLNIFWALGLSNKNAILEEGPMQDQRYGNNPARFASTGGWTLAVGNAMEHYSVHKFISLTTEQQAMVERMSKNIYRPCCNNTTHFPDCNHGMAMLGLLEFMASQGMGEEEMYAVILQVNAYGFPDVYMTIAQYMEAGGTAWSNVNPEEILGAEYSSSKGYQRILAEVTPVDNQGKGSSCGA